MELFAAAEIGPRRVTLVRLSGEIARNLAPIGRIAVDGEVHSARRAGSRLWFTLRDRNARLSVTVPAARLRHCRAEDGEHVRVTGSLEWDNQRGALRLEAQSVEPIGEGAVAAVVNQARAALAADGILDRRRRPIPRLPRMIAVVCGQEAAVRKDIEAVVLDRFPGFPVVFRVASVSGPGASEGIAAAVAEVDSWPEVDVIILARGGGDATELLPFSDEVLCRVVARCRAAVVSAIGHDGDRPLVDDVADLRCGTPSIAAAAVVPSERELRAAVDDSLERCRAAVEWHLENAVRRLASGDPARALVAGLDQARSRLERAGARLERHHPMQRLREEHARLDGRRGVLDALDPVRVLERGFAIVRADDGRVVRDVTSLQPGSALDVQLANGRVSVTVTSIEGERP